MKCRECDQVGDCLTSCQSGAELLRLLDEMWEAPRPILLLLEQEEDEEDEEVPPTIRDEEEPFLLTRQIPYQPHTCCVIGA